MRAAYPAAIAEESYVLGVFRPEVPYSQPARCVDLASERASTINSATSNGVAELNRRSAALFRVNRSQ